MPMAYAELFCRSNFSFLQGASSPEELVEQAAALGYEALALTDECSVAGIVRAYRQIREQQLALKLIVGSYFQLDNLRLVLLCPNRQAYAELCRIISNSRRRASKGQYQLDSWDLLSARHCLALWLPQGDAASDQQWGPWLAKHFAGRLSLAVVRHLRYQESAYLTQCDALAAQFNVEQVAVGAVLMHKPARLALQQVLTAIRLKQPVQQLGRQLLSNAEASLRPVTKLARLYSETALATTLVLAARCTFCLTELKYEYPAELVPAGQTASGYLRALVEQGAERRFADTGIPAAVRLLIEKELSLITELKYEYFFLTIYDLVQFAKGRHILYQGRGSAANSVVCYCLEITAVDPRQIKVLFERFLSRERREPPDIDVDFEHERREEVIQYLYQKYGRERAAIAATVISYRFKSALRDVGKALGINEAQLDYFINNVNRRHAAVSWQQQLSQLGLDATQGLGQQLVSLVEQIRGFPRHLSQHVGGFVISAGPLYELVPVENAAMAERTVIQWDKDDLETLGLLKVDVLALGMLTAIRRCFALVAKHYQQALSIHSINTLGDDARVYQMIQRADTVGLFQIESRAQMSMLPRLRPEKYYDLVIQIAIVRPGPIQGDMVHPYLQRRHGLEAVSYPSAAVAGVLERTLGVPIFQEQVIQLAMVAAGFSGGEADQLRRAMASWKKTGELLQFKEKLIQGMLKNGYSQQYAERIYQQICGFGEYGFPESHSASFAVLAYVSAWLKYYYPAAFYTALLNSYPMGFYSPAQLIQDAKRHHITVLPICVNHSNWEHELACCPLPAANSQQTAEHSLSAESPLALAQQAATPLTPVEVASIAAEPTTNWGIRLGLRLVKGLTEQAAKVLQQQRPAGGFSGLTQLKQLGLSKADLAALASSNALQALSGDRYNSRWHLLDQQDQLPLFAASNENTPAYLAAPDARAAMLEDYQATGLSLTLHPLAWLRQQQKLRGCVVASQLEQVRHKAVVSVAGLVAGRQSPGTAAGVTFITLEDETGNVNIIVWQGTALAQQKAYLTAKILKVNGILERAGDVTHIIAGRLTDLTPLLADLSSSSRDFH
ncbi:error-prone DNA polymerase [Alishewanella longhuensis]|uniref:Error-prone DNA polymerase n=2 Tax=Alishewanella longhuensis TaxID=1091037 RepID=A0ABQ3L604_9ALTE|nr:error-prone DNA polymerase [Alishewanella longhuensis]